MKDTFKKIVLLVIILLGLVSFNVNVFAEDEDLEQDSEQEVELFVDLTKKNEVKTFDRNEMENLGVKKHWKITDSNKDNILRTKAVDASDKIYDFSGVLTKEEEDTLREQMNAFTEKTNMDIIIVVDRVPYSSDSKNEEYASDFYDYNDFGMNYNNSGVLLFRNTYEPDPYFNIYTFGDCQLYFDYDRLENTLDSIYSPLHSGDYTYGFKLFVEKMEYYYNSGIAPAKKHFTVDENGYLVEHFHINWFITLGGALLITVITISSMVSKNKMIRKASTAGEYLNKESYKVTHKQDIFVTSHTTSYTTSSSSGGGGGHSSGGSSGGGHSSGGGRHG